MAPLHRTPGTRGTLDILERFNARYLERSGDGLVGIQATRALPAFSVAGIEIRDRGEAPTPIRQGIDFFYKERRKIEKPIQRDVYLGLMSPRETGPRAYLPSIQVGPDSIVPPEFTVRGAGPFSYGVFRYMGPHDPRDIDPYELGALGTTSSGPGSLRSARPRMREQRSSASTSPSAVGSTASATSTTRSAAWMRSRRRARADHGTRLGSVGSEPDL